MSPASDWPLGEAGSLERGNFTYFPVCPGRVEFALEARQAILAAQPAVVAIEMPGAFERAFRRALKRLPEMSVIVALDEENDDRAVYVPVEPADPFVEAARTALEIGAELVFLEPGAGERPHVDDRYPDPYAVRRIGYQRYVETYRLHPHPRGGAVERHASGMAWKLQGADPGAKNFVVVSLNLLDALLDAMEEPQPEPETPPATPEIQLINPHPECLAEITVEMPYLQERYLRWRDEGMLEGRLIDRPRVQFDLLGDAGQSYEALTGEKVRHWQRRLLARFTRNLALSAGDLVAGLYDLTVAARSLVDDNYAWEVWQTANRYGPQKDASELETVSLSGSEVFLRTRRLRIRRRLPRPKRLTRPVNLKPHKREKTPGEWARQLDGNAICSYPPEDLVVEDYGRFLKQKAKSVVSEERSRVEPFRTSLLDGIDLRETIRNWYQKKIYVRQNQKLAGEVGAVVVIFDEDRANHYRYRTTWLGENQNESDMAFYSTHPFDHLIGPGIGRAEYGGFLMALPPRRMYDVWSDHDYDFAETKPERLLLAALDYSVERYVVYVAARPPRSVFRSVAAHLNRKILYIPIGQLPPTKLKKIRVVHVLDGYERRKTAKEFLW